MDKFIDDGVYVLSVIFKKKIYSVLDMDSSQYIFVLLNLSMNGSF